MLSLVWNKCPIVFDTLYDLGRPYLKKHMFFSFYLKACLQENEQKAMWVQYMSGEHFTSHDAYSGGWETSNGGMKNEFVPICTGPNHCYPTCIQHTPIRIARTQYRPIRSALGLWGAKPKRHPYLLSLFSIQISGPPVLFNQISCSPVFPTKPCHAIPGHQLNTQYYIYTKIFPTQVGPPPHPPAPDIPITSL